MANPQAEARHCLAFLLNKWVMIYYWQWWSVLITIIIQSLLSSDPCAQCILCPQSSLCLLSRLAVISSSLNSSLRLCQPVGQLQLRLCSLCSKFNRCHPVKIHVPVGQADWFCDSFGVTWTDNRTWQKLSISLLSLLLSVSSSLSLVPTPPPTSPVHP